VESAAAVLDESVLIGEPVQVERVQGDLQDVLGAARDAVDRVSDRPGPKALAVVEETHGLLTERLLPHEYTEEHQLNPALAPTLGGPEATAAMSRAHTEIERLSAASPPASNLPTPRWPGSRTTRRPALLPLRPQHRAAPALHPGSREPLLPRPVDTACRGHAAR
jgi:hypothetical protein